jgi:hypothetical protein
VKQRRMNLPTFEVFSLIEPVFSRFLKQRAVLTAKKMESSLALTLADLELLRMETKVPNQILLLLLLLLRNQQAVSSNEQTSPNKLNKTSKQTIK